MTDALNWMKLDPKGLEAASKAVVREWAAMTAEMHPHMSVREIAQAFVSPGNHRLLRTAINAYLEATPSLTAPTPAEVGGLVERLLRADLDAVQQAASLIQSQAARIAELEAGLKPFSKIPSHGTFGGPLCGMKAVYEDGSDSKIPPDHSVLGHEPVSRARALLGGENAE